MRLEIETPAESRPFVAHNTGKVEWYTPPIYLEAARRVMGAIDLDPASSEIANRNVRAATIYTKEDNGLIKPWFGRVWMNPPYAPQLVGKFAGKLVGHYRDGDIEAGFALVNNASETRWFQCLLEGCSAVCFVRGRIRFINPEGIASGGPLQGQVIFYFGKDIDAFVREFSGFGVITLPMKGGE